VRILVVGGGGREHALCWALAPSATVFCAPGNPGTASLGINIPLDPLDSDAVAAAVADHAIDLTVIGPEAPLAAGLADRLTALAHPVFGPTAAAAKLESSKAYAKHVMRETGVPTAASESFTDLHAAVGYIGQHREPLVVKASGLAAGKGAVICRDRADAEREAREMFAGKFGDAGREVLVEEFLEGEELSVLALTDGEQVMLLPASQDHKRLEEGDRGPNTGGMGAYTPVATAQDALLDRVLEETIRPVIAHQAALGAPYRGVLYVGIMVDQAGEPRVLEFNCRFGDPEAQVVLPVLNVDLAEHLWRIAAGEAWVPEAIPATQAAVTTVLAAPGYPHQPLKGAEITVAGTLPDDTILFHAGTARDPAGILRTAGGRVLCATGLGPDVQTAASRSRALAGAVSFPDKVFRRDIAWREIARAGVT
jgi:phosphoribosylamine--glycine ligase